MNTDYFNEFSYDNLSHLQVGKVCEYWVKVFLTLEGFDVYTSEVDDKGIDFVVRLDRAIHIDIQVKSVRLKKSSYVFITKAKEWKTLNETYRNLYLALVLLRDGAAPEVFLIPATAWLTANELLCERNYGKTYPDGRKQSSRPEWGIYIAAKKHGTFATV